MTALLAPRRESTSCAGITVTWQPSTRLDPASPRRDRAAIDGPGDQPVAGRLPTRQEGEERWACEWWPPD
jgi:hypothetical protein